MKKIYKKFTLIFACLSLTSCATIIGSSDDKEFIRDSSEIDFSNPKEVSIDLQLTKQSGNNIEINLKEKTLFQEVPIKEYEITHTHYSESHPFLWLLTFWNPFSWIIGGDIFGYQELFGERFSSTSHITERTGGYTGSAVWLDTTKNKNRNIKVYSNVICKKECNVITKDGKGLFSVSHAMVDNNILTSEELSGEDSTDLKFVPSIPIPGSNIEKTITVSSLADNVKEANLILAKQKEAEEQARKQEAIRQEEKRVREKERLAQSNNGSCHTDLSYLSSRIPSFSLPALNDVRSAILSENLHNTMRAAKQQGYSAESAIQASLEQARAYDDTVRQALRTAAATDGFGTTDDEFLDSLKRGTLRVSTCDGIRNAALCDAINNKLGAIASRATAADMQCHLRAGTWSN